MNSAQYIVLYPQKGERIVTIDSDVTTHCVYAILTLIDRISTRYTSGPGADLGVIRVTSNPRGAAAYFMLLLCV